jgi:hypothetical protein
LVQQQQVSALFFHKPVVLDKPASFGRKKERPKSATVKSSHLLLAVLLLIAGCEGFFALLIAKGLVGQDGPSVVEVRLPVKDAVAAEKDSAIAIDARDLMSVYEDDEIKADARYKNRRLLVTGPVAEIGKDLPAGPFIAIQAGNQVFTIQCFLEGNDEIVGAQLKKGTVVSIVGTCDGQAGNVFLKNCVLLGDASHLAEKLKKEGG